MCSMNIHLCPNNRACPIGHCLCSTYVHRSYRNCNVEPSRVLPVLHSEGRPQGVPSAQGGGPGAVGDDQVRGEDPAVRVQFHPGGGGGDGEGMVGWLCWLCHRGRFRDILECVHTYLKPASVDSQGQHSSIMFFSIFVLVCLFVCRCVLTLQG